MSVSIYYTATRNSPLIDIEKTAIERIVLEKDVSAELETYLETGKGFNWETFTIYDLDKPSTENVIFEGATKLPNNTEEAIIVGLEHWLDTLTEIRRVVKGASWHVHVDDTDISWNEDKQAFDKSILP